MTQLHHIIARQRIRSERRLLDTPITRVLSDSRNLVRLTKREHELHHTGTLRLDPSRLPLEIFEFAADYALESALDHELSLLAGRRA